MNPFPSKQSLKLIFSSAKALAGAKASAFLYKAADYKKAAPQQQNENQPDAPQPKPKAPDQK